MHHVDLIADIGLSIVAATGLGVLAKALRQPLLLAYLAAGILLGPRMGLGLVTDEATISLIAEIGLILLLFIIGLEIDLKKLAASGRTLVVTGLSQFPLGVALGLGFFGVLGFSLGQGRFDALYLAVALALSSTMIVVKLLYDKFELTTLPGRITLGVLVFQDVWAILFLAVQPNLADPAVGTVLWSFVKGGLLVAAALAVSKFLLPRLFAFIAKVPELLLVTAVSWCFLVSGAAEAAGLSREMGALVAGVSLSTFPYNVDVIAKVINIRDFFVTLFFVGLGMQIPVPTGELLGYAAMASAFLVASRFASVFPVLYGLKNGLRPSLICSINLAQMSEFSLVIAALGLQMGHISDQTVGILTFVFAATSVASTYMIQYNHEIHKVLASGLRRLGFRDVAGGGDREPGHKDPDIVFLGFFREASSIFQDIGDLRPAAGEPDGVDPGRPWPPEILVVDFNPAVMRELARRGVRCVYGDVANLDTLAHTHIESARVVVSSIPNSVLRGTTNQRILRMVKRLCRRARVVVTANTIGGAISLYADGADFVFVPRVHSSRRTAEVVLAFLDGVGDEVREAERTGLAARDEVLG
ncbi:cation:proton antiporter [Desulfolutivibrio sulfoxidireducens]|uniref:cation:proton antiporter n=1 Tax=Desulfolutivibrio sulfoxidireducens TaxID=2773299 RepID=UPI00159E2559|nr:cation:proton antiporter [Desulfolutivibrio sulfoxidireducens]QLA17870.1 sodium:proton exchanger [Desulfolutivibrio sulfoxidireducens]QLA21450.1 sodium:proton exchanger [Desulfolutivibrio sulfoxidireducens]